MSINEKWMRIFKEGRQLTGPEKTRARALAKARQKKAEQLNKEAQVFIAATLGMLGTQTPAPLEPCAREEDRRRGEELMTEQCMHDGKAGPCERRAVALEHFCRRHLPKKAGPKRAKKPAQCDCATTGYEHTARCQNMQ